MPRCRYYGILTSFPRSSLSSLRRDVENLDENQAFCDLVNTSLTGWILFLPDHEIKLSFQNPSGAFFQISKEPTEKLARFNVYAVKRVLYRLLVVSDF